MPYKHNEPRRHKIPKARYRVENWREYEVALRDRGSLTVWVTPEAIAAWHPARTGRPTPSAWPQRHSLPGRRHPTVRHATNAPPPPSCVGPNSASVLHRRPRGRLRQLWGSAPAPPRASALHQSSFRNLRLRFNYRSQMSQLTVTHPTRRRTPRSARSPERECRSSRSSDGLAIAASSFARFCGARERTSSHLGKARSTPICPSLTHNGRVAVGRAPSFGDVLRNKASVGPYVWSANGRRGAVARKGASDQRLHKVPPARTIARLMTGKRDHMSKADTVTVAAIQAGVPSLVEAHALIQRFHVMIRKKEAGPLDPWIADAKLSLISSFATGIARDKSAVRAAITEPWSNGQ